MTKLQAKRTKRSRGVRMKGEGHNSWQTRMKAERIEDRANTQQQEEETMTDATTKEKGIMDNFDRWTTVVKDMAEQAGMEIEVDRNTDYGKIEVRTRMPKGHTVSTTVVGFFLFRGSGNYSMQVRFTRYCNRFGIDLGRTTMNSRIPTVAIQNCMDEMEARNGPPVKTVSLRYKFRRSAQRVARRIGTALDIFQAR